MGYWYLQKNDKGLSATYKSDFLHLSTCQTFVVIPYFQIKSCTRMKSSVGFRVILMCQSHCSGCPFMNVILTFADPKIDDKIKVQLLWLFAGSSKCITHSEVLHETMHLLGFVHEHNRMDRDQYVTVLNENIKPGLIKELLIKLLQ